VFIKMKIEPHSEIFSKSLFKITTRKFNTTLHHSFHTTLPRSGIRGGAWSSRPCRLLVVFCGFLPCRRGRRRSGLKILRRS
jgi:hypothetical protein